MNVQQLRTFIEVAEHRSFSEAARMLGISQPAVTMQIQALETDVGAMLLDRRYRKVELTEAGRVLIPFARRVLGDMDEARAAIDGLSQTVTGRLAVAASTTPGQYVLPHALGAFLKEYPEVGVSLRVYDTAEVVEHVASGEAHLGMTGAEVAGARVVYEQMGTDRLELLCSPDNPIAKREQIALGDLVDEPFIVREAGSGTRMVVEEVMRRAGVDPAELRVVLELGTNEAVLSAVEGGMGIGVVSAHVSDKALTLGTVARIQALDFPLTRPLFLVLPRTTPTRAAQALANHLRDTL
ncbi:MAG TPA: selenium metabolism-associated LysR family transcriptional regulator [Coriobacteriia bacterium]|nr:selenium metabolism-associated LysR family transcriptional regulator [Coriobacteriia bacterium]